MHDVLCLSSYTPGKCGINPFNEDLTRSIDMLHVLKPATIIAVDELRSNNNYVSLFREVIQ